MTLNRCHCGRTTDFGTLCVFCAKDQLIKQVEEEVKRIYNNDDEEEEETD